MDFVNIIFINRVQVIFNDRDVWARCVENHDKDGVPQAVVGYNPFQRGTGWRDQYVGSLDTREEVANFLAFNIYWLGNNLSALNGWTDMSDDAVTITELSLAATQEKRVGT